MGPPGLPETGILESTGLSTDGLLHASLSSAVATSVEPGVVPDNSANVIVATGIFIPDDAPVLVQVTNGTWTYNCYSGVQGNGFGCIPESVTELRFVLPPLPIGGPYSLVFTAEGGLPVTLAGVITVVHRAFTTNLFQLRGSFAAPRDVGPYTIKDAD